MNRSRHATTIRRIAPVLALFAAFLVSADAAPAASRDKRFAFTDTKPDLAPPASAGHLVLVREQIVRKNPMPPERLYLDARPLGYLPQRGVVVAEVGPGLHRLEGVLGCPPLVFEIGPGERVLLRLREVIDEQDAVRARWLLEDPDFAGDLIDQMELLNVQVTPRGLEELARRWRTVDVAMRADSILAPQAPGAALVIPEAWFEHPLDPLNWRRDFSTYSGRLEIGAREITYAMDRRNRDVRVAIPIADVVGLRFGGIRSAGVAPWLDLFYRSEGQTLRASFADAGPEPEAGYNRMFGAIRTRWLSGRAGAAGTRPESGAER